MILDITDYVHTSDISCTHSRLGAVVELKFIIEEAGNSETVKQVILERYDINVERHTVDVYGLSPRSPVRPTGRWQ